MELCSFLSPVFFSCFCIQAHILHSCLCVASMNGNVTDQLALLQIKTRITSDPFGVLATWNGSIHYCNWHGVTCGRRHKRVLRLDLNSLKLAGSISPHIGNLSFLREIRLYNNSFSQEIPPQISRLHRLQDLILGNNSLCGEIPSELSACSQLLTLSLGYNSLVGEIPKELGSLSKLKIIRIHVNKLTGSIPYSFANLSSLEVLSAFSNHLSGNIPDSLGRLINLDFLGLGLNNLSGTLPPSIFNLSLMNAFGVELNKIHGTLPSNLGSAFPNLEKLSLSANQFSGPIPASISNASNLVRLELAINKLHGKVPSLKNLHQIEWLILSENHLGSDRAGDLTFLCDLSNTTRLQIVQIHQNDFGGNLPQCIGNLSSSLLHFDANRNKIFGSIPKEIVNLVNLESLGLFKNQFSGHIPADLGKLHKLYQLYLSGNSLSGNVPFSLGNLTSLGQLYLNGNQLQGNLPSTLAECSNLMILSLATNNLSGNIPEQIMDTSNLRTLILSQNHFTGSLPSDVGRLINLEYLDVSRNKLSGVIPQTLGTCIKLEYLYMDANLFQGNIPSSFGSLRGLQKLFLSHNNLSGQIPESLEQFQVLYYLDLSYNNLEGMVPVEGVFKNATATSVEGNSKLCGGIPEFHLQKCKLQHLDKGGWSIYMNLIICLVLGILGVTSALACLYIRRLSKMKKESTSNDSDNFLKVSYQSLQKATDGFSSVNLIGMGSFGSVYKGVLEQSETTVAIKVLNLVCHGAYKSFTAECEALRNIRHRNLVKLLSACSGVDYGGHDFKALIYEFMVNGSLDDWLHPTLRTRETTERTRSLSFSQRLNVAIDVAMAIDYLHHHCGTTIVHCDLKPSNILLDADMVGHVGDFGLARFLPKPDESSSAANQPSSAGVKGTIGYAPSEYGIGHEIWTPGDVYSYGILLLEIFTAKRPTDAMFQGSANLHNFVKAALPDQVVEILDPVLVQEHVGNVLSISNHTNRDSNHRNRGNTNVGIKVEESLISILEVGVACSVESPIERSDISDVVAQMCWIRNKLEKLSAFMFV